ncbi:MAG: hypothetical protein MR210_02985 [Erysipelotrichaceae bacterium]|nr:hypothetical protein [Erysipelotrichaceae bacterium]
MDNNYNTYDTEINLIDLFYYLLKQMKSFIIALIIGALLGTGIFVYRNNANVTKMVSMQNNNTILNVDIDDKLIPDMEVAAQYRGLYEKQLEYNNNSLLMKINPNNVYQGKLQYYINAENNTFLISNLYKI